MQSPSLSSASSSPSMSSISSASPKSAATESIKEEVDAVIALNNSYECLSPLSFDNESVDSNSFEEETTTISGVESNNLEWLRALSDRIRVEIEKLAAKSILNRRTNLNFDETFITSLFGIFYSANYKVENFREIESELNVLRSQQFLILAKLGHECFKLGLFSTSECLLNLALNRIDTQSQRLKMATLSTLSACYWRQSKYLNAIECMHDELDLATKLGLEMKSSNDPVANKNPYAYNRYRIYGNLASAHQRLKNFDQCMQNLRSQLSLSMSELNDPKLAVNSLNSIAILHQRMGEIERCRDCLQKSLELIEKSSLVGGDLELRQLNLLGNVCLKQADYTWSREYFMRQLWLSTELKAYLNEATALLNLGFLSTKIKTNTESSSSYYERCLLSLNTNFDTDHIRDVNLEQSVVELYAKCFIGLINSHLSQKDILNASLYAHSMLDFTLKQMQKPKSPKLDKYLKCMEINACSKLAVCYARQNRLSDAIKLHEREALLAQELNNILYLTRAYSHLGHLLHASKDYQGAISYYKLILAKIETNLVTSGGVPIRDERIIELIFFTLSNIGYCLDASGKYHEAKSMFEEQLEMARLLPGQKGVKSRAAALLNLVNLSINETSKIEYSQLMGYLKGLLLVYEELNDLNGQLFVTQCLAYSCHKEGDLNEAAQFYMKNIELATRLGQKESLSRSLFNASLCFKSLKDVQNAFKLQTDYYNLIQKDPATNLFSKFVSLGLIAELSFEIDDSDENCQRCLEIHLDRLNLIRNFEDENKEDDENKKYKLIFDCLESISKLYTKMREHEEVIKFKQLQLNLLNEDNSSDEKLLMQRKCKLWLELGSLHLQSSQQQEASKYFELVLNEAMKQADLLLESLAVGNLGLCRQKEGNFLKAIELFKKQKSLLVQKLTELSSSENNRDREKIPIRIDLARAEAKIGKCYESLGNSNRAEAHFKEYAIECERLQKDYSNSQDDDLKDLKEQIYVDYDTSLEELGKYYVENGKFDNAIELNETRLKLIDMNVLSEKRARNIKLQSFFNLARIFAIKQKLQKPENWDKSVQLCENLAEMFNDEIDSKEMIIETELLRFDLIFESNPSEALKSALNAYRVASNLEIFNVRSLKLKHATTSRLCHAYRSQSRLKECLETLMSSLSQLGAEFQEFEASENEQQTAPNSKLLTAQYAEYLFLLHRRIALIHMEYSRGDRRAHLLALKHVNDALIYLNSQQRDAKLAEFRLASVYYLLGVCHQSLGNAEMELEMFACSLDFYENLAQLGGLDLSRETLIRDKLIEENTLVGVNYEEDEETVVKYSERVSKLYELILDALLRMNKLKESILVIERYKSRLLSSSLGTLPDLLDFDQVESLINDERFNCVLYYHFNDSDSSLNCWVLKPNRGIVKFEKLEAFDSKLLSSQDLEALYDVFVRPIESELDERSMLWLVYDERMFKLPFHMLHPKGTSNRRLYERFELNCAYSLKYLARSVYSNQIYTRRRITESGATFLPMKVVSSEEEMKKLLDRFGAKSHRLQNEQFDLLLLLVNPEHKDVRSLNGLVNTLISKKITKSVLIEFTHTNRVKLKKQNLIEFEQKANIYLKRLYSNMLNRTCLTSTLIYTTLWNNNSSEENLLSFLLFGCLGLNTLKRLVQNNGDEEKETKETTLVKDEQQQRLDDVLFELTINDASNEVTFSQVINQYLILSTRVDNLYQVLNLTIGILHDYLNGIFAPNENISLIELFEDRLIDFKSQYKIVSATRLMLKRLGFSYFIDTNGKCMVKLPQIGLEKKLNLIHRCLSTFETFSTKLVQELFELSKKPQGKELFILMKQHQLNSRLNKSTKTQIVLKESTFKQNETFIREFTCLKSLSREEEKVTVEADSDVFNKLVLITSILLNDYLIREAETMIEDYVEVYFREIDKEKEESIFNNDDESLSLSSMLKIQSSKASSDEGVRIEINFEREPDFKEIKIHQEPILVKEKRNQENHQKQRKTVKFKDIYESTTITKRSNEEINRNFYNNQMYELVETTTNYFENKNYEQMEVLESSKSLVKLEEKEYMNKMISTTTVKTTSATTTSTNEELLTLFDNVIYDVCNLNEEEPTAVNKANDAESSSSAQHKIKSSFEKLFFSKIRTFKR